jgi:preprotein translocase subunit SecA
MGKLVAEINALGESLKSVSDADLRGQTAQMQQAFRDGKSLDELLPQAFAVAREAATRVPCPSFA